MFINKRKRTEIKETVYSKDILGTKNGSSMLWHLCENPYLEPLFLRVLNVGFS